ncbi:MAG: hypothetical protein AABY18_01300 [Candidatus Thermoplasmatota archaeon]
MRKVDVVLVALVVVAAAATAIAVAKSGSWTEERTYSFAATQVSLAAQGPAPASSAPARFEWPAAANATGASLTVFVNFTGQAIQGGQAIVRIAGLAPDGSNLAPATRTLDVVQGSTAGGTSLLYNATWADVPGDRRDTGVPEGMAWQKPLVITVTVERPGDLAAASYSFTASVGGSFAAFVVA